MTLDYTTHLRADGEAMARAVATDLDAHVPTCPDWNVAKLTIHTGQHHRWVADAVRKRGEPPQDPPKPGLRGDALEAWFRDGWGALADLLDGVADDEPAWTWSVEQRAGFWRRRTALETLVHRWDAQNAVGTPSPLDPALAADGVDEMLFVMMAEGAYAGAAFGMDVSASDAAGAWSLRVEDGEVPEASRSALDDPDVTLGGRAEDLLLFLWGRRGPETVEIDGRAEAKDALLRWIAE
jgi:uncharacterized protein (TIGR03083 family)